MNKMVLLRKTLKYIFGEEESFSLEHRLFLFSIVVGSLIGIIGTGFAAFLAPTFLPVFISLFLTVILIIIYYFVRFKSIVEPFLLPISILSITCISIIWVFGGGMNGPNLIIAYVILILTLIFVPNKSKVIVISFFIISLIIIYLIQLFKPELIVHYHTPLDQWKDSIFTSVYCSIAIFIIIKYLHKHYTIERVRAEDNEKKVQALNLELIELNKAKDKFFSIIAHDIKSPFSGFLGLTKILAERIQDLTLNEMEEISKIMQNSASQLYKLLENLLEWSQIQQGIIKYNPESCLLSLIIQHNIEIQSDISRQKEIEFVNNISDDVYVTADIFMLNTVFRNIFTNAIKFSYRGGKVEIGLALLYSDPDSSNNPGNVCVYVKDTGIGMMKDMCDKLFKIDCDVSSPGTEGEPSTGLGLILCKEFINKQGGTIWIESDLGKGCTFYFTLPKEEKIIV
jgi:signal transduction histidine kinase